MGERKIKISHIINPFFAKKGNRSYLDVAQPITFKTMLRAKQVAERSNINVKLMTCQFSNKDLEGVPKAFITTPHLEKSILDYKDFGSLKLKLPRICDILQKAYDHSDDDYVVYTNVDIAVMPTFYKNIYDLITKDGFESMVINRVDISKFARRDEPFGLRNIDAAYRRSNVAGEWHSGKDCFVFKRDMIPKYNLKNIIVGIDKIGICLMSEIYKYTPEKKFLWIADGTRPENRFTFHLGNDMSYRGPRFKGYRGHNIQEAISIEDPIFKHLTWEAHPKKKRLSRIIL